MRSLSLLHLIAALLFLAPLTAQPRLIDSIEQRLAVETDTREQMDLLLGLCRAVLFTYGGERIKPIVARAQEHATVTADSAGLGQALLFQYMSDFTVEEGIPAESIAALRLSKVSNDRSLEIFVAYHVAEHFLLDKNDLVNARKWFDYGRRRLTPSVNPKHRGNLYKDLARYHKVLGNQDSVDYWLAVAETEFSRVGTFTAPELGRTPSGNWDGGAMNRIQVLNEQGNSAMARGNFPLAKQKFAEALAEARKWQVDNLISRTLDNIGEFQTLVGDTEGAIASFTAALETHKAHQNKL